MGRLDLIDVPRDEDLVTAERTVTVEDSLGAPNGASTAAHEITKTVLCKEAGCEWDAEATRGRYAGLCRDHKAGAVALARQQLSEIASRPRPGSRHGELAKLADELKGAARRVERASKTLDDERAALRNLYLRFGVSAGFLTPR